MPWSSPSRSTTGRRRTRASHMVLNALWMSSSGPHVRGTREFTSRTVTSDAGLFLVLRAIHISRSVMTLVTFPLSSTTGSAPQSWSHISAVASARFVPGWQNTTDFIIRSRTRMLVTPLRHALGHSSVPDAEFYMLSKFANCRLDQSQEIFYSHMNQVSVRAGVECDELFVHQTAIEENLQTE